MHTYILDTSKRWIFGFVTVPKPASDNALYADITYETSMTWVLSPTPSWPGMGSIKCLSTRWRGQSTGSGTGMIPCGCCHALLNMCFTSSILNCQCIFLMSEYFLWGICALSITMFKQCTKNFFDHLTLVHRKL